MGVYDDPFGSILIGSWLASVLAGLVLNQAYRYFAMYPKDPISRKAIVVCSMLFLRRGAYSGLCKRLLVTFWGNTERVQKQYWPVPMYVTMNTCVGVIVNSFLIHRFYTLSKNIVICMVLSAFVILGFAGSILVAVTIQMFSAFSAVSARDISTYMVNLNSDGRYIHRSRSDLEAADAEDRIQRDTILDQPTHHSTVQTGSTTSVVSIVTLVSYIIKNDSNVPTACCYLIGPLYLLTLFYNLNLRQHDLSLNVHRVTVEAADPTRSVPQAGYNNSSMKDPETESYGGKKVPEF
ncbi:hypothetical protein B0H14DRAFT_3436319 [Mycena olivaceomarginata]|nr:hypothetical protein B0H14DRAFT_3436319 [Mycena olivaceomarginata]